MTNEIIKKKKFQNNRNTKGSNRKPSNRNKLKVMALGGLGEVGKNCYVIEYGSKLFVVDFGVLFPDKNQLGVDYVIPNYEYLKQNERRIEGLFITHGHEDHIGGIPFLLKKVRIKKIYAPLIAKMMIEKKLKDHNISNVKLIEINEYSALKFNEVTMYTYHQTHSIPDSLGFFFETPVGNVATTGDFKIDFSPSGEKRADFEKMVDLSKKGVTLLISDSTNALKSGFSISSDDIGNNLKLLMKEAKGRILYTTFASHINRVQKIVEGALENNRKICVLGRSMKTNITIGITSGYIKLKKSDLIDPKEISKYNPEQICILSTGSQGEVLAALSRIAHGLNPHIDLSEEDTVVFASSPIPGNNYQIGKVIDQLKRTGCKVVSNQPYLLTHTSGHASQEEEKLILSLFKPKHFMPMHGTYQMISGHRATAVKLGMNKKDTYLMDNGDVLVFTKTEQPKIIRKYAKGKSVFVSGNNIDVSLKDSNISKVASDGILIFTTLRKKNNYLVAYPQLTTRGFVLINSSLDTLKKIQKKFITIFNENRKLNDDELLEKINTNLSRYIYNETGKSPFIKVNLINYKPIKTKRVVEKKVKNTNN